MQLTKRLSLPSDRAGAFVYQMAGVYLAWKVLHYLLHHTTGVLHDYWQQFVLWMAILLAKCSTAVLLVFKQDVFQQGAVVIYRHSLKNITAAEHCLAIPAMVIFSGSILLFDGAAKNKAWFIPLGVLLIFVINVIRFSILCYTFENASPLFYNINHSFIYVVATYSLIMLLIVWWMRRFAGTTQTDAAKQNTPIADTTVR